MTILRQSSAPVRTTLPGAERANVSGPWTRLLTTLTAAFGRVSPRTPSAPSDCRPASKESSDIVIHVHGLKTVFGTEVVSEHLDLDVRRGEILGVVGGSGTGKSVLMRSIVGLQHPVAGEIAVFGEATIGPKVNPGSTVRSRWGVMFQDGALFSTLTVAENIAVPLREYYPNLSEQLLLEIAGYKIVMCGLSAETATKFPAELSGGMRKRAGLARALALDPELLFLDEPTAGLDPVSAAAFDDLIKGLQHTLGLTVFLVTHDLDTLYAICDRVAVLADHKVIAVGTIAELMASDHPWIEAYFRGPRGRAAAATANRARVQQKHVEGAAPPASAARLIGANDRAAVS